MSRGGILVRAPEVLLALLMLTIPLEFTELWFPNQLFQVGRLVMVGVILTLLVGAVWGGQAVRLPAWNLWVPPAAFIAYALVSALVTRSLPGLRTAGAALAYALVAVAIYNWTRTVPRQERVWFWLAVSCVGLAVIAIIQRITGGYIWNPPTAGLARVNATFADPNVLGRVLTCMIVAGVALAPAIAGRRTRLVILAAILMSAAALPFTYSRQAWVIGGVALVLAVVASRRRRETLMVAGAAVAVFAAVTLLVPEVQSRFGVLQQNLTGPPTHIFERPGLAFLNYLPLDSERHYLIAAGLQMFYDHPIFGIGFGGFPNAILGPYSGFILSGYTTSESHTTLVTILAELGIAGLLLASWWAVEYVRVSIRGIRRNEARRAFILAPLIAVVVIFLESQLNARLVDEPYLWVFVGLAWAAMAFEDAPEARATQPTATTMSAATSQNSTARSFFQ
jgi:putative inorganic carbon (HCO3(-)) transporter